MYVTRPLSMYKRDPEALKSPPQEGPNSGILVILDEEAEDEITCCFGTCKSDELPDLPFPQNKLLRTRYTTRTSSGSAHDGTSSTTTYSDKVVFIPVLDHPLSSNRYYAIQPRGSHQGEAFESSKEEDTATCCFCCILVSDVKPQPFNPSSTHQQFEISKRSSTTFHAKSVAEDGIPPTFLSRKGWSVVFKSSPNLELRQAPGLDSKLRNKLPELNSSPVVVGRWYIPFIFVKEGSVKEQMNRSMYYEMVLEQRWERIYGCDNDGSGGDSVVVDVSDERDVLSRDGGVVWFRNDGREIGLSAEVVERMYWEEERFGYVRGEGREVKVKRVEKCDGFQWRRFDCYVLVERFNLKRLNGSLVWSFDFKHVDRVRSHWE